MKNTVIPLIGVSCLLLVACTGSFTKVRTAIDQAPDWYDARRHEIRGEGYPEIIEVPTIEVGEMPGKTLVVSKERGAELRRDFEADARAAPPANIAAEIESLRESARREFAGYEANSEFLTDEEIKAIRSAFNVPRVTRGLRATSR